MTPSHLGTVEDLDRDIRGMQLRDYFAATALPAVIEHCSGDTRKPGEVQADYFARLCYELSDAMLKARLK
jgi:hypothetical protein